MLPVSLIEAMAQLWPSPGLSLSDPSVSPIEGASLLVGSGIAVQIHVGTLDIFWPSAERFKQRVAALGGGQVDLDLFTVSSPG